MLIYVIKRSENIYEPLVDADGQFGIYIPSWTAEDVMEAESAGEKYREHGATLGFVDDDVLNALDARLGMFLRRVEDAKMVMENLNPYAEKLSLESFMSCNSAILQSGGNSFLQKGTDGKLHLIDEEYARKEIRAYEEYQDTYDEEYEDDEEEYDSLYDKMKRMFKNIS